MKLQELKSLFEARQPNLTYTETKVKEVLTKVTLELEGANSAVATKLAKRYERLDRTAKMLKEKRDELNAKVKGVGDELFNAEDVLITRVIQTVSYTMMLTAAEKAEHKKPTNKIDYESAFKALAALVPDLEEQAKALLKAYTEVVPPKDTPTQLKVAARVKEGLNEGILGDFMKSVKSVAKNLMNSVKSWATGYDKQLNAIKKQFPVGKPVMEATSKTVADTLESLMKMSSKSLARDPSFEKGTALSSKIVKLLPETGTVSEDDEMAYFEDDVGNPDAEANFDSGYEMWQHELKDAKWAVRMHKPEGGWYHQGLIKHNKKPFMYFVLTDGESGVWVINKITPK